MICRRCGHKLGKRKDGWRKCPKCGLAKFDPKVVKPEKSEKKAEKK